MTKLTASRHRATILLLPLIASLASCAAVQNPSTPSLASNGSNGTLAASAPSVASISLPQDPAQAMQGRVTMYPSPWPELQQLDQGQDNLRKLTGTLARMQSLAVRNPSIRNELPEVLVNGQNNCINTPTLGIYSRKCETIKIDYTDGNLSFQYPVEIEAVLAHEWGHHLAIGSGLHVSGTEHEIVADCFAGVVFGYYINNSLISLDEAVKALEMMAQLSNNSETDIHPNQQNRTSAFMGGLAHIADPRGQYGPLYDQYCGSLEQIIDTSKIQVMGLSWKG